MDLNFFAGLQSSLEKEAERKDEIRSTVKELDAAVRKQNAILNQIQADPTAKVPKIDYRDIKKNLHVLVNLIPNNEFYKYNDLWSRTTQQAVFLITFASYLNKREIVDIVPTVEEILEVKVDLHNNLIEFHIPLEDVLHAYISLIGELSRLCVNSVTVGDYERPLTISKHVKDLSAGFQLLNLKNDALRKRFDGIKYDVKKIEEVVYDITLRGLHRQNRKRALDEEGHETKME